MKKICSFLERSKALLLVSALSFTFVCCSKKYLIPIQADVSVAQSHWPGTTFAKLTKGYDIYTDKCSDCHRLRNPKKYSVADWNNKYMPTMGRKAKLTPDEYYLVLHYILAKREELTAPKK